MPTGPFCVLMRLVGMGQNNDPKEHDDLEGQQGVIDADRKMPPPVPYIPSRDGVDELTGGEAEKPGQSSHDERADQQDKS
jgi:hypothetical protein